MNEKSRRWRHRNPAAAKAAVRRSHLKKKYGITPERFLELLAAQENACAICRRAEQRLGVDHNHTTGVARGLLCTACNQMLGQCREDPKILVAAMVYLAEFNQ